VERAGAALDAARVAVVLLHGRGATAASILELADALAAPAAAFLAPQAPGGSWYPNRFLAPIASNEPWLTQALAAVAGVVDECARSGVPATRVALAGFSQGACLACEFAARNPKRWGAVVGWTGGRIGPPGSRFAAAAGFDATPVLLASGDPDPHVPWERVEETARFFRASGAIVEVRRRPGFPHTIHPADLATARDWVVEIASGG
jgi:predicted esterase